MLGKIGDKCSVRVVCCAMGEVGYEVYDVLFSVMA